MLWLNIVRSSLNISKRKRFRWTWIKSEKIRKSSQYFLKKKSRYWILLGGEFYCKYTFRVFRWRAKFLGIYNNLWRVTPNWLLFRPIRSLGRSKSIWKIIDIIVSKSSKIIKKLQLPPWAYCFPMVSHFIPKFSGIRIKNFRADSFSN